MFWKSLKSKEYCELLEKYEALRIKFAAMEIDLQMIVKKFKVKYKLSRPTEEEEPKDTLSAVLLPE